MQFTEEQFIQLCDFIVEFQGQFGGISAKMTKETYDDYSVYITTFHIKEESGFEPKFNLSTGALQIPDRFCIELSGLEFKLPGQDMFFPFDLLPIYFILATPLDEFLADENKLKFFIGQLLSIIVGYYTSLKQALEVKFMRNTDIKN